VNRWTLGGLLLAMAALSPACGSGDDDAGSAGGGADAEAGPEASIEASLSEDGATGDAKEAGTPDAPSVDAAQEATDDASDLCADAGVPASSLDCTGLYSDFANKLIAPSALTYTPATPLWSDGAQKQRWIELPALTQIDISNPNEWSFPVGTKVFKEFRVGGKRVETRLFQKTKGPAGAYWVYAAYAWNADDSAAPINFGGPVTVGDGGTWNIPTNDDCDECHRGRQDRILGFEQVGLGMAGAQGLTLAELVERGLVTPAPASVSLAIGDDGTGLNGLALAWIHVNCGVTCHNSNPSAAGNGASMLLRLDPSQLDGTPPDPATWDVLRTTLGVPCVSGSLSGQPRIRPNDPGHSEVYELIDERGLLQMPPIASLVVDAPDVAIVGAWIESMMLDGGASNPDAATVDATVNDSAEAGSMAADD
jgi:hypothetical protein